MNKAEKWLRSQKYTPDLMFSWEWVIRALNEYASLPAKQSVTDEDIEKWAEDLYGCSGTQFGSALREVNIAIRGAKAHRDNLIKKG